MPRGLEIVAPLGCVALAATDPRAFAGVPRPLAGTLPLPRGPPLATPTPLPRLVVVDCEIELVTFDDGADIS